MCAVLSVYICMLQGIFSGRGRQLLFADADGASRFSDLDKLEAELSKIKTEVNVHLAQQTTDTVSLCEPASSL